MQKVFPALSLDLVSEELPWCGEMEWVNQGSGQAQHQARWFMPRSHKSWVDGTSPEAVYREDVCMLVSCLPCKDITEDCTGLFSKSGKVSASVLPLFFCTLSTRLSVRPCCPPVLCTASAHLTLSHLLPPHTDVPGCAWMQDSNAVGSLGTVGFLVSAVEGRVWP